MSGNSVKRDLLLGEHCGSEDFSPLRVGEFSEALSIRHIHPSAMYFSPLRVGEFSEAGRGTRMA